MTERALFWRRTMTEVPVDPESRRALFMRLARENEAVLLRVARRLCTGNEDRAADCAQDAIVSAFKAFDQGRFTDIANFRPWILRILTNAFLVDERRQRRIMVTDSVVDLVEGRQRPTEAEPERKLLSKGYSEEIEVALKSLPADQLTCVTLVDIEDMGYADAAQLMDVPIGTVRSRLARARIKMANEILRFRQQEANT
jgi:RNA polymerase sigma-70 factor (ECF subfamily)